MWEVVIALLANDLLHYINKQINTNQRKHTLQNQQGNTLINDFIEASIVHVQFCGAFFLMGMYMIIMMMMMVMIYVPLRTCNVFTIFQGAFWAYGRVYRPGYWAGSVKGVLDGLETDFASSLKA